MIPIEQTPYRRAILHKLEMSFGNIFLCEDVIVSEINEGVLFTTVEAKRVIKLAVAFYEKENKVKKRVYIANRINSYSVNPLGWVKLNKTIDSYLKAYCVVDDSSNGIMNAILESKFVPINFKSVRKLEEAIKWSNQLNKEQVKAS